MLTTKERPSFAGVYPISDAAALLEATIPLTPDVPAKYRPLRDITTRHLYRWAKDGLTGDYLVGLQGGDVALTFLDLVSLRMVAVFRSYGIKSNEVREAHDTLQAYRGWAHPFAMEPVWISGLNIVIREHNIPIAINRHWQIALDFIDNFVGPVHRLIFGKDSLAEAWEPEPGILLDPKVSFGESCLKGTRIATQSLWALHAAGDSVEQIACAYQVPVEQVESAIGWEERLSI